jgi:hypothetical protein
MKLVFDEELVPGLALRIKKNTLGSRFTMHAAAPAAVL